jgi:hypothetical protein
MIPKRGTAGGVASGKYLSTLRRYLGFELSHLSCVSDNICGVSDALQRGCQIKNMQQGITIETNL